MLELPTPDISDLIVTSLQDRVGRDIVDVGLGPHGTVRIYDHTGREHVVAILATDRAQCPECQGAHWALTKDSGGHGWVIDCPTCAGEGTVPAPENNLRGSAA